MPLNKRMLEQRSYMDCLSELVHSSECLSSKGYITALLSDADLEKKRRCARCNSLLSKKQRPPRSKPLPKQDPTNSDPPSLFASNVPDEIDSLGLERLQLEETRAPVMRSASGDCELIRLTLIDYFSNHVLIDKLVWPDVLMSHLNTKWSGVTWKLLYEARKEKRCILGWKNARALIWKYVSAETIVIGHGANSDLSSLRWIHPRIIDTLIVERNNSDETTGLSLKKLAEKRLQRIIQKGKGHDSLEDATATRDLVHWNVARMLEGGSS
ncbi:uncharacterized protein FPOAC1_013879 [Fusarium poae]|uniref:uncharacterized protein n=1 Tax=Fusarium poae TaxID=36050 RepID=UPI001D03A8CA|nr:uncharacterized protein FPOAC1_013879 [Fusarium poae]KAG8664172.1 hypothetical protein FPOAC1_013879 [Fusarium poae]